MGEIPIGKLQGFIGTTGSSQDGAIKLSGLRRHKSPVISAMSKAFLREDNLPDSDLPPTPAAVLPRDKKNYITARGLERLRGQLAELNDQRTALREATADPEAKRRLQIIDQRIRHRRQSLYGAEVVALAPEPPDVIRFGATVTVRDSAGEESVYRIVGVDETDLDRGEVSWLSPLAQALLNARQGERVGFKTPRGQTELEIVKIAYE